MNEPIVSIIVPVYNVEKFCRKCFDSLLAIRYPNKEIILVNDCSNDKSGVICDEYSQKHNEILVVHHKGNKGVQQARITGLNHAHGAYIMFVDSDDYVHSDILKLLIEYMDNDEADMVCCQYFNCFENACYPEIRTVFGSFNRQQIEELFYGPLLFDEKINRAGMPMHLWGKLFKPDILKGSLEKGLGLDYGEDEVAVMDIIVNKTYKLVCFGKPLYYYVHHPSQITAKTIADLWPSYIEVWKRLETIGEWSWDSVLQKRMWLSLKPSIYTKFGKVNVIKYIHAMKSLRNSSIVKKYIFSAPNLPKNIYYHPHYILLNYRLYFLDYILYAIIWLLPKK